MKYGFSRKQKAAKLANTKIASDIANVDKHLKYMPDNTNKNKTKKSTMINTISNKSNPLKDAQATDTDNRDLGSARGGNEPTTFDPVKSSSKKSVGKAKNIANKSKGVEDDQKLVSSDAIPKRQTR